MTRDGNEEKTDVLVISDDVAGARMAGPGIRAWEISRCLAKHFSVALAVPDFSSPDGEDPFFKEAPFEVFRYGLHKPRVLLERGERSRIILIQGYVLSKFPGLIELPAHLIADIYVPFVFENLFNQKWKVPSLKDRENIHLHDLRVFNGQILACDHFLCANSRQRDLFTGSLLSLARINPRMLDFTAGLEDLICVVPFGLSGEPEESGGKDFIRKTFPGIGEDDTVFLWGGVLTNWFDPLTLIRAFDEALRQNPKIKLLFMSTTHANPLLPGFDMAEKALRLSEELGLAGRSVFFNHGWVPYTQRGLFFSGADVGLSLNPGHFENRYAARTRMLDYLKYGLPILCTEGDEFSETIGEKNLGLVVKPRDRESLREAILTLAADRKLRGGIGKNIAAVRKNFLWEKTTEPLVGHCRKVLGGQAGDKRTPTPKELGFLFLPAKKAGLKKFAKRHFWRRAQKLPHRHSSKIKRLLKM